MHFRMDKEFYRKTSVARSAKTIGIRTKAERPSPGGRGEVGGMAWDSRMLGPDA